jgi:hypothetical protein
VADEHYQEAVVSCVRTRAGNGEVLVQAAHSLEAGATHAMELAEGRNLTEAAHLQLEGIIGYGKSGKAQDRSLLAQNLATYRGASRFVSGGYPRIKFSSRVVPRLRVLQGGLAHRATPINCR